MKHTPTDSEISMTQQERAEFRKDFMVNKMAREEMNARPTDSENHYLQSMTKHNSAGMAFIEACKANCSPEEIKEKAEAVRSLQD